jgi:hypothetical protein
MQDGARRDLRIAAHQLLAHQDIMRGRLRQHRHLSETAALERDVPHLLGTAAGVSSAAAPTMAQPTTFAGTMAMAIDDPGCARTVLALQGNVEALQRRLPDGRELAPYAGDDLR